MHSRGGLFREFMTYTMGGNDVIYKKADFQKFANLDDLPNNNVERSII